MSEFAPSNVKESAKADETARNASDAPTSAAPESAVDVNAILAKVGALVHPHASAHT